MIKGHILTSESHLIGGEEGSKKGICLLVQADDHPIFPVFPVILPVSVLKNI